jgi:hypothetical protein
MCLSPYGDCDKVAANGCEVALPTDPANCGTCGNVCTLANATAGCAGGTCTVASCNQEYGDCDGNPTNGCEVLLDNDLGNCGKCGSPCAPANAVPFCSLGTCLYSSCKAGYADCDHKPATGCEIDTQTDPMNCGACGTLCTVPNAVAGCAMGACSVGSCNAGYGDCDGQEPNGCETNLTTDPNNCGACGRVGGAEKACNGIDDNCNGTVDEGCPAGVFLDGTSGTKGPLHGSVAGTTWTSTGLQVFLSVAGQTYCHVDQLSVGSGSLNTSVNTSASPYTYSVSTAASGSQGPWGGTGTTAYSGVCPPNSFITGIFGSASATTVDSIGFYCGAAVITGSTPGAYTVSVVTVGTLGSWGGTPAGCTPGPTFTDQCPTGYAVGGFNGSNFVNGTAMNVGSIQITCYPIKLMTK